MGLGLSLGHTHEQKVELRLELIITPFRCFVCLEPINLEFFDEVRNRLFLESVRAEYEDLKRGVLPTWCIACGRSGFDIWKHRNRYISYMHLFGGRTKKELRILLKGLKPA